ncbi:MAG: TM2 domain-containing protein [Synechococcus sp.]|nr:TM2 domain-containing protein [Synechococcus sp.]
MSSHHPLPSLRPAPPGQERRSLALSYLLWCLCLVGVCGLQRFYNRKPLSGLLWLFSFGLCGLGQLVDLLLLPTLVQEANQALQQQDAGVDSRAIERQLLALARRSGARGFTLNDAVLDLQLPPGVDSTVVRTEIQRLLVSELLDVGNDDRGRVVYREP